MNNKYFKLNHRFALGASVSLFLVFTLLFYAPLKIYIENIETLWYDFDSVWMLTIIASGIGMVVCTLLASIPKKTIHTVLCCLIFALALGLCIQGNLFNIEYGSGVLDGSKIAWKDYTTYGAIDSAMWAACLAMPFAIFMVFKGQWRKILMFTSLALVLIQAVVLSVVVYQNYNSLDDNITYEVTTSGIYDLSQRRNTLVFVLDSFDADYLAKIKKDFPDYETRLEGFTEYDNNLAGASGAIVGLPSLLTGEVYKRDTSYSDYIDNIWSGDNLYSTLNKSGVDTRIFAQTEYFSKDAKSSVKNIVDHISGSSAYTALTKTMYKYTLYNYAPHYLKQFFWLDLDTIYKYRSENAYSLNDAKFYSEYVQAEGFNYTSEYKNALRIYNLDGARTPYTLTKNTIKKSSGTSLDEQIYGCFNCLFTMLDDLKENGMYKNATIIITANNGNKKYAQNPVLLIKRTGEDEGYTISHAPTSAFDLAPTLASIVTEDYSKYGSGKTFFEFNDDDLRTRDFYLNAGDNSDTRIEQYSTTDNAKDADKMKLIDCYYSKRKSTEKYRLGTSLTFAMDATANTYCTDGFTHTTGWRTQLAGPYARMIIPLSNVPDDAQDIHVFVGIHSIEKNTKCVIKANDKNVYIANLNSSYKKDGLNFTIPASLIGDDNTITLEFKFTDIKTQELKEDLSKRTKTVSFSSFKMYTQ